MDSIKNWAAITNRYIPPLNPRGYYTTLTTCGLDPRVEDIPQQAENPFLRWCDRWLHNHRQIRFYNKDFKEEDIPPPPPTYQHDDDEGYPPDVRFPPLSPLPAFYQDVDERYPPPPANERYPPPPANDRYPPPANERIPPSANEGIPPPPPPPPQPEWYTTYAWVPVVYQTAWFYTPTNQFPTAYWTPQPTYLDQ